MIRNLTYSCLILVLTLSVIAHGQNLPTAKPESVGLSSERLDRIAKTVQRNIDDKHIAGAVTMVVRHGQVAWLKAQGMQDREAGKPMQPDTIFRICSMTKPITSVAVMMLYEQGYFALEDPISKYLPEFKNPRVLVKTATGFERAAVIGLMASMVDCLVHGMVDNSYFLIDLSLVFWLTLALVQLIESGSPRQEESAT